MRSLSKFDGTDVNVEPESVVEETAVSQQMDITSVDVKANGMDEFLFCRLWIYEEYVIR
jgi:hypothetical protein